MHVVEIGLTSSGAAMSQARGEAINTLYSGGISALEDHTKVATVIKVKLISHGTSAHHNH